MRRILIVDNTRDFSVLLEKSLSPTYQVEVCSSAKEAKELLRLFEPSVMILEMMVPEGGLSVLEYAQREGLTPKVIVITRFVSDYLLNTLSRFCVEYVALKPCTIESITDRVDDLMGTLPELQLTHPSPQNMLRAVLHDMRFSSKQKGYHYIVDGALMLALDPCQLVTKEIYPVLSKKYFTSDTAVEKAIRNAIDSAWSRREDSVWRRYLCASVGGMVPKPSNSELLASLAELITHPMAHKAV